VAELVWPLDNKGILSREDVDLQPDGSDRLPPVLIRLYRALSRLINAIAACGARTLAPLMT
jgi:hypothetical protein